MHNPKNRRKTRSYSCTLMINLMFQIKKKSVFPMSLGAIKLLSGHCLNTSCIFLWGFGLPLWRCHGHVSHSQSWSAITHRIHGAGIYIYANIWGILMVNVAIYIAAPWILCLKMLNVSHWKTTNRAIENQPYGLSPHFVDLALGQASTSGTAVKCGWFNLQPANRFLNFETECTSTS